MSLYLHERLRVPVERHAEFSTLFQSSLLPAMYSLDAELIGIWKHSSIKGDPAEIVAIWKLQDWTHAERLQEASSARGGALSGYYDRFPCVRERSASLLRQRAGDEALDRLRKPGVSTRFCFHETMYIEPGRELDYVRAMELQLGPSMRNIGLSMVGEFQPVFESGKIINLWAVESGFEAMVKMGKTDDDVYLDGGYWMEIGLSLRKRWRSVWMLPLPTAA